MVKCALHSLDMVWLQTGKPQGAILDLCPGSDRENTNTASSCLHLIRKDWYTIA